MFLASGITFLVVIFLVLANYRGTREAVEATDLAHRHAFPSLQALNDMRFGVVRIVASINELTVLSASRNDGRMDSDRQ